MAAKFNRTEWGLLLILALVQFTHIVDFMLMMPLGPQLMRILVITPAQFSLLVSIYTFCAGLTGFASAFFLDRFDRKRSLIFFFTGFGLGTLACGLAPNYEALLVARAITGAFGGVLGSQIFAIIGDVFVPEKRGTAMGVVMGAFSFASIFGVPFSLYLANQGSWHTPLLALGGLCVPLLGLIVWKVPKLRGHLEGGASSSWAFVKSLPGQRRPLMAMAMIACLILGQFMIVPFLSPSFVANAGLREDQLPLIYFVGGGISLFGAPFFGRLSDRFGPARVLLWSAPLSVVPFLWITHLGNVPLAVALTAATCFFFVMGGRMVPAMTFVSGSVQPRNRGAFMSLTSSMQQFAAATASAVAGRIVVKDAAGHLLHYEVLGYAASILTLVALVMVYRLRHEPSQVLVASSPSPVTPS